MRKLLVVLLAFVVGFGAGFAFDRWQHRPLALDMAQTNGPFTLVVPVVSSVDQLPSYDTLVEAAVHGAQRAYQCSHVYECGAVLAQRPDGRYVVGPMASERAGDHTEIPNGHPIGWTVAGDVHSHPCLKDSHVPHVFSPPDISGSLTSKVPGFMLDMCTGDVHEFDPAVDSPNDLEIEPGVFVTAGRIVGHVVVDGLSVEPDTGL